MGGIVASAKNARPLPIEGSIRDWENRVQNQGIGGGNVETAAVFDRNGNPLGAYLGERHSVSFRPQDLQIEGATFTHFHPNPSFGGTLSLQDLKVFARSKWDEIRAYTGQGKLYSVKAGSNVDREGLSKWIKSHEKLLQKNFAQSYNSALKNATTELKSGPHAGKVKLRQPDGSYKYVNPLTPKQAAAYARTYSVGMFDRAYKKALSKYGVIYTSTNAGKNA